MSLLPDSSYQKLIVQIGGLLHQGRQQAAQAVNSLLVQTYWQIGRYIVEFGQNSNTKAEYGSELLDKLSQYLRLQYSKGFSRSNPFQMRLFYTKFSKIQTASEQLSWSHYVEILKAENELEINLV
jgi:hypothetical protein